MPKHCTLLYAESDAACAREVQRRLEIHDIDAILVASDMAGITALSQHPIDLLVANFRLGSGSGLAILRAARKAWPDLPALLLLEADDIGQAAPAIREEGLDYLVKDGVGLYLDQLPRLVDRLVRSSSSAQSEAARRMLETRLNEERSIMLALANHEHDGVAVFGPDLRMQLCNARFLSFLALPDTLGMAGTELTEILRYRTARGDFGPDADAGRMAQQIKQLGTQANFRIEQTNHEGVTHQVSVTRFEQGSLLLAYTEPAGRHAAQAGWRNVSYDGLTGLPGNELFMELLRHQLQRGSRCGYNGAALLLLDLDGFRQLNEAHGNQKCDQLLAEVAQRLTRAVRESDVVGRLDGDQFGIMVVDVNTSENSEIVAGKLLAAIARPFRIHGIDVRLTASIGIGFFPTEFHTAQGLLGMVENAVLQAKEAGKNRYMFA